MLPSQSSINPSDAEPNLTEMPPGAIESRDHPPIPNQRVESTGEEWQTFASFNVQFQRRQIADQVEQQSTIQHQETGNVETWNSFDIEPLQRWMLAQVQPMAHVSPKSTVQEKTSLADRQAEIHTSAGKQSIALQIIRIQLEQPTQLESPMVVTQPGQIFVNSIQQGEAFELEVTFNLTQPNSDRSWSEQHKVPCSVECYARHYATGAITHLGTATTDIMIQGEASYTARLPEAVLTAGMYRLQVIATLQSAFATPGYFEIPVLQVV